MDRKKIKKAELHLHLDGSLRPETILDIAKSDNIKLPTFDLEELKNYLKVEEGNKDLVDYLKRFEIPVKIMQNKKNLKRVAYELVEDLAKENYIYVEIRFAPHLHIEEGLDMVEVVEAVIEGIREAEDKYDIKANLLLCIMRHMMVSKGYEVLNLAKKFKGNKVVGIDLAGDEFNYSALLFKDIFKKAKEDGIQFTIHAGEARGVDSIREALECGASRLGHGIRAFEDEELLNELKEKNIVLECCPISNYHTQAVKDFREYPLKNYINQELKATLNTDNRTVSDTNYEKELEFLDRYRPLSIDEVKKCSINAIIGAFINEDEKNDLLKKIQTY